MAASFPQKIILIALAALNYVTARGQAPRTEVMMVGCDHLSALYQKDNPNTDVLTAPRQAEMARLTARLARYQPDMLVVEQLPETQARIDSLYGLYRQGQLNPATLPDGRSELYQVAFRLAKQLNLPRVYCVNAPGGTSQGILRRGQNIELYQTAAAALTKARTEKVTALQKGQLTLYEYLVALNQPELYNLVYRLRYITPARVVNARFTNPDRMVDTAFVNPRYIGAELISIFKNRDYKIYSNIVVQVLAAKPRRVLVLFGAAHTGSLQSIFADDPEFRVVKANKFLKK